MKGWGSLLRPSLYMGLRLGCTDAGLLCLLTTRRQGRATRIAAKLGQGTSGIVVVYGQLLTRHGFWQDVDTSKATTITARIHRVGGARTAAAHWVARGRLCMVCLLRVRLN